MIIIFYIIIVKVKKTFKQYPNLFDYLHISKLYSPIFSETNYDDDKINIDSESFSFYKKILII